MDAPVKEKKKYNTLPVKRLKKQKLPKVNDKMSQEEYDKAMAEILILPSNAGRKRKFTPTKLRNRINDYFNFIKNNKKPNGKPLMPSVRGMCSYLNISKDSWYTSYKNYEETREICSQAEDRIHAWVMDDIYNDEKTTTNKQFVTKYELGLVDKTEVVQQVTLTPDLAMAKLERLIPTLLQALGLDAKQLESAPKEKLIEINPKNDFSTLDSACAI